MDSLSLGSNILRKGPGSEARLPGHFSVPSLNLECSGDFPWIRACPVRVCELKALVSFGFLVLLCFYSSWLDFAVMFRHQGLLGSNARPATWCLDTYSKPHKVGNRIKAK